MEQKNTYRSALVFLTTLFFAWGLITVLNDILVPHLKNLFDLSYFEASLIQFIFFAAYFVMALPASFLIRRLGYQNGIVVGLGISALGAFMFVPASYIISYPFFLSALFILACGVTVLQVSANPYVTELGKPEFASSRLNMTQGFNSLGTAVAGLLGSLIILGSFTFNPFYEAGDATIHKFNPTEIGKLELPESNSLSGATSGPVVFMDRDSSVWYSEKVSVVRFKGDAVTRFATAAPGVTPEDAVGILIEEDAEKNVTVRWLNEAELQVFRAEEASMVRVPYLGICITLLILAFIFWRAKLPKIEYKDETKEKANLLHFPHLISGSIAIFFYVGAEVAIGTYLVLFLSNDEIAGFSEKQAGIYLSLYWLGAMIGRFIGTVVTRYIKPNRVLAISAFMAMTLVTITVFATGSLSMWSILSVGLFNSIMFPTIFALSVQGLGKHTQQGSGLLISMIVGGAIIPPLMGLVGDALDDIQTSFIIATICYAFILFFAVVGYKLKAKHTAS